MARVGLNILKIRGNINMKTLLLKLTELFAFWCTAIKATYDLSMLRDVSNLRR
jgi:hypothetical protein